MLRLRWPSAKNPQVKGTITESRRGFFTLLVPEGELRSIWKIVRKLTREGQLDYMSTYAPYFGYRMVCVWVREEEMSRVLSIVLQENGDLLSYVKDFEYRFEAGQRSQTSLENEVDIQEEPDDISDDDE